VTVASLPRWDELVVVAAGTPFDGIPMPERHVAVHLSHRIPVLWVDPPISLLTPLRDRDSLRALRDDRLRLVGTNLARLSPVTVPGVTRPVLRDIATRQARAAVRRAVARLGSRVRCTIVAGLEDMLDVVAAERRLFYGTDDFVAGASLMHRDPDWSRSREHRQLELADTVVAISPVLHDLWAPRHPNVLMIPNGCDAEHFAGVDDAPMPADVTLAGPIAGFVGHISERIDLAMLEAVADTGASLLLVGPIKPTFEPERMSVLLARSNVQAVGSKSFAEMPSYLRVIDVGLTPYGQSDFNRASFPLKTLEYLSAGRPTVATDLPAHRWLDERFVTIASTPVDFAARTRELLAVPRNAAEAARRREYGAHHSWASRTREIAAAIGLAPADVTPRVALR
jgi:teichuronic acid biosynthesis glycosyltransferase TuaH